MIPRFLGWSSNAYYHENTLPQWSPGSIKKVPQGHRGLGQGVSSTERLKIVQDIRPDIHQLMIALLVVSTTPEFGIWFVD